MNAIWANRLVAGTRKWAEVPASRKAGVKAELASRVENGKISAELCGICTDLAKIVTEQQKLLAQHDAIALAEDIDRVKVRYTALIGSGEWPDEALGEEL